MMTRINKVFLISHCHTDIGYTDHARPLRAHHQRILERAIDLCDSTYDLPEGAQHRWTAELTSTTLDFLRQADHGLQRRFQRLNQTGRLAIGAMHSHWTPLVTPELAEISLQDIDELRNRFNATVRAAMVCDVNGLAQFWIKMLLQRGIDFISFHQNPHRGYFGPMIPSAWFWEDIDGNRLLVHQGLHYFHGALMNLGRLGQQDGGKLRRRLLKLEASPHWPFDFAVINITNVANSDNAFPEPHLSDAVLHWNDHNDDIAFEIVTLDQLRDIMYANCEGLPTYRGEWMDCWADGVASTPLATAVARAAERLLPMLRELAGESSVKEMARELMRFDEHTFGSYTAAKAPEGLFSIMQETDKSNAAFQAFALALDQLAIHARKRAAAVTDSPVEGDATFSNVSHPSDAWDQQTFLVANPNPHTVRVYQAVPRDFGSGLRYCVPQACSTDEFFPGMGAHDWPESEARFAKYTTRMLDATLAPFESRLVTPTVPDTGNLRSDSLILENEHLRLCVSATSGGLTSWIDKDTGTEWLTCDGDCFRPEMQLMSTRHSRREIFKWPYWERYWERIEQPTVWGENALFDAVSPTVRHIEQGIVGGHAQLSMRLDFDGKLAVETTLRLAPKQKVIFLQAMVDARMLEQPFSLQWPVRFKPPTRGIRIDVGKRFIDVLDQHLPWSSTRWQTVHRGIIFDTHGESLVVVPLDTPLFQPGGPWHSWPCSKPTDVTGGTFWSNNNHWDTNFPVRTTYRNPVRFIVSCTSPERAIEQATTLQAVPIVVRTPHAQQARPFFEHVGE